MTFATRHSERSEESTDGFIGGNDAGFFAALRMTGRSCVNRKSKIENNHAAPL
jgi:hypothetical protein